MKRRAIQCQPYGLRAEAQHPGWRRERISALWPKRERPLIRLVIRLYLTSIRQTERSRP
jgi:hypothetical protein